MMLMTLDIDGTIRRVSSEELALTYPWYAEVSQAPSIKYATERLYGGYCKPSFGGFTLIPGVTRERKIGCTVQYTETDESEAVTFLDGIAHRTGFNELGVSYTLLKPDDETTIKANITGNLQTVFATYCGASYINKTLDTSATSRNPAVSYNVTADTNTRDVLSAIAAFFCHGFYEDETTVYLYDMLADNGTLAIDSSDFEPAQYEDQVFVSMFRAGDYTVSGTYPNGTEFNVSPVCHTTQANIEAALADIKTIVEQPGAILKLPLCEKVKNIRPGMRLSWASAAINPGVAMWIRVQSLAYDFTSAAPTLIVEGQGDVEAYLLEDSDIWSDEDYIIG